MKTMNTTGNLPNLPKKTSIIMVAFDKDYIHRHITSTALGNIQMFTDREDYEMILVDNEPTRGGDLNRKYQLFYLDHHIIQDKDIGVSASRNIGAKIADPKSEYFCFIDNDVFVWEGWLPKLISYLESGELDAVWPHQCMTTREFVKNSYDPNSNDQGNDDAGLILITRDAFEKTGGWDERFFSVYHDLAFRRRMSAAEIRVRATNRVIVTHLNGATTFDLKNFQENLDREAKIINKNHE